MEIGSMRILLTVPASILDYIWLCPELVRACCGVYLPQAAECSSEETVLPEIALALAVSRNWVNADFIDGASLTLS